MVCIVTALFLCCCLCCWELFCFFFVFLMLHFFKPLLTEAPESACFHQEVLYYCFWGRMVASGLNFNIYSFSVTSIFHPCQAIHYYLNDVICRSRSLSSSAAEPHIHAPHVGSDQYSSSLNKLVIKLLKVHFVSCFLTTTSHLS